MAIIIGYILYQLKKIKNMEKENNSVNNNDNDNLNNTEKHTEQKNDKTTMRENAMKNATKVENPLKMRKRLERYKIFSKFLNDQKHEDNVFKTLMLSDEKAKLINDFYTLNVCSGGFNGESQYNIIDIFWGNRIYGIVFRENHGSNQKFSMESGAFMRMILTPQGYINIIITGAKLDDENSEEQLWYIIDRKVNPNKLNDKKYIQKIWKKFLAFSESTHLDGDPSITQRNTAWRIRNCCKSINPNASINNSKMTNYIQSIIKWAITVGLSGALLLLINFCNEDDETKQFNQIEMQCDSISKQILTIERNIESSDETILKIKNDFDHFYKKYEENQKLSKSHK